MPSRCAQAAFQFQEADDHIDDEKASDKIGFVHGFLK
jgi:hypothetical protein